MRIIAEPHEFFSEMKTHGGFSEPLKFLLINSAITALLASSGMILTIYLRGVAINSGSLFIVLLAVISAVLSSLVLPFFGSGVLFYVISYFGGRSTYEATYRIMAYLSAFYLLFWIPALFLWTPYLALVGLAVLIAFVLYVASIMAKAISTIHKISFKHSAVAVFLSFTLVILVVLVISSIRYVL